MRGAVSGADVLDAPPADAPPDAPRVDPDGALDATWARVPAAWSWPPWCDAREPALRERLARRLGGGARITLRAPGEPVEAPLLLCGLDALGAALGAGRRDAWIGSWRCLALARRPSPELTARVLDAGACDVLDEAEPAAALLARLRAHDRSHLAGPGAVRPIGPWRLDALRGRARHARTGAVARLTPTEAMVLRRLAMGAGEVVPDAEMLGEVLGYCRAAETHTLETHVWRLRRKLEADPRRPRLIVRGREGYRLLAGAA